MLAALWQGPVSALQQPRVAEGQLSNVKKLEADLVVRHVRVEVGQQFSLLDQDLPRLQVLLHQKIF